VLTTDRTKTNRHNDERRSRLLKRKRLNNFLSNLNRMQTKQAHPDVTSRMTMISE